MRLIGVGLLLMASAVLAFGQQLGTYGSVGGFGNVVHPGTGHAPAAGGGTYGSVGGWGNVVYPGTGHAPNSAASYAGRPPVYINRYPARPSHVEHQHGRGYIVPYPVYIGGYYGPDPYAQPQQSDVVDANGMPSVIVNPNFVQERANPVVRNYGDDSGDSSGGMKVYQTPPTRPYADQGPVTPRPDPQPTIYLLAFKDHNIVASLGYWMDGTTLHYVSIEHSLNQASIDLIDRDLSQRLNQERGVEFTLPEAVTALNYELP